MGFLRGIQSIDDFSFAEQLMANLIGYFDWGMINAGAFFNAKRNYGTKSTLTPASIPGTPLGVVWEARYGNWIRETGLASSTQPVVSTVYVNNVLVSSGFSINYDYGQITFDVAKNLNSSVQAEYSYRKYDFVEADDNWFYDVVVNPMDGSSLQQVLANNRLYLPAIILEIVPNTEFRGYQLGDSTFDFRQDVLFHILANTSADRDRAVQAITFEYNRSFDMYDLNAVARANPGNLAFPSLVNAYPGPKCVFYSMRSQDITSRLNLYRGVVRAKIQAYI